MKNRYNWTQVAQVYCQELGIDYPRMEEYLRGIFSDIPIEEYENEITELLIKNKDTNKSEYFPDLYCVNHIKNNAPDKKVTKNKKQLKSPNIFHKKRLL